MRDSLDRRSGAKRIIAMFALTGSIMWFFAAVFVSLAFAQDAGPGDWVLMHRQKMEAGVGLGLGAIGTLFICFAALISVTWHNSRGD